MKISNDAKMRLHRRELLQTASALVGGASGVSSAAACGVLRFAMILHHAR